MFDLASDQAEVGQAGTPGEDALLSRAIVQLKVDIRGEVFQVKPTGDPGPPKLQPMCVGVGCEPPTQDVADHGRPASPGITPRPHRRLTNHLTRDHEIEPFPLGGVIDHRLLQRAQFLPGRLSDPHEP